MAESGREVCVHRPILLNDKYEKFYHLLIFETLEIKFPPAFFSLKSNSKTIREKFSSPISVPSP